MRWWSCEKKGSKNLYAFYNRITPFHLIISSHKSFGGGGGKNGIFIFFVKMWTQIQPSFIARDKEIKEAYEKDNSLFFKRWPN